LVGHWLLKENNTMTSALQYITNIDTSFPKPGQNNSSQGFRSNFNNIKEALDNLNSYMDSLSATTLNINAPLLTATQQLTALNFLTIGSQTSVTLSLQGYSEIIATGKNSDGTNGSGIVPLFLHVIPVGRRSYGTDVTYGSYFVANSSISSVFPGGTFYNLDKTTKFTVTRVSVSDNRIYFTPSTQNLPATVNITNPSLGGGYEAFRATLGEIFPYGSIILWYGSVGIIPDGWQLCNGSNGTPDLRNKFVLGAGNTYAVGDTGGSTDAVLVNHNHTFTGDALPVHQHDSGWGEIGGGPYGNARYPVQGSARTDYDNYSFLTSPVSGGTPAGTISTEGVTAINANMPPYYALCYIMKII